MQDYDYESDVPVFMETIKQTHSPPHRWQILRTVFGVAMASFVLSIVAVGASKGHSDGLISRF